MGGAGAGPSLRLWAAFISGTFLSWESTWAQSQTISEAADRPVPGTTGGVVVGRGSQGMPPCLCGGQTTPVDAKSPSGQDGARLSEERGRAELNQCGLHRPPPPPPALPGSWGLSREPVCPEPSQRHGLDPHGGLSKPLSPLPPAVLGPRNCHQGTGSPSLLPLTEDTSQLL